MSRLLNNILDKISENNNEYRSKLRILNASIDEKSASLVSDIVTISSYTADFSNTVAQAKEKLVNPILRVIESYVIKDLRSVENVNEQFVEKINDKLDSANIASNEEKESFIQNLHSLLNEKYLEIVKIKRVNFFDENNTNSDIEKIISDFIDYLKSIASFDEEKLLETFNNYKNEIYDLISQTLVKISDLYLDNFVSEVSSALKSAINYDNSFEDVTKNEEFKPFIPDINPVPEINIPDGSDNYLTNDENNGNVLDEKNNLENDNQYSIPEFSEIPEIPQVPEIPNINSEEENTQPIDITPIAPIEINEGQVTEDMPKRSYDVEEILKIAKSPIVAIPDEEKESDDSYINVEPIISEEEQQDTIDAEFNEKEIVEEMINRLSKRLEKINERRSKYEENKRKLEEDEAFVNDLIESSAIKKEELDKFEQELDKKEKELEERQTQLDKKINNVMPFANAVLNNDKES